MRKASLEYIANEMSLVNTSEVTKKIKKLRSTYNQERAKIEKSKKSGSGSEDVYKSSLKWFDIMDYIMKTINLKEKETTSNLVTAPSLQKKMYFSLNFSAAIFDLLLIREQAILGNAFISDLHVPSLTIHRRGPILEDDVSRDIDDKTVNKSIESSDTSLIKNKNPVQVKNKLKHNITQETSGIAAVINELKQLNSTIQTSSCSQQCDEYDVIGKHVAIQLRQLPLLDFIDAKDEIQQVLSRYRKKAIYARNTSAFSSYNTSSPPSYISLTSPGSSVLSDSFPEPVPISDRPAETVSRQPVQTVVGQPSSASYEAIHFSDPLVRAMIDANMNNMQ
ncbi:unnamed protein product [Acanthoscelides obtectus]|uniref:MADF domain-containing protein n=1 Tax=Acanthoscelides obtectus TaxID=200917 RepID=A0A9P0NUN0_ACAOB|nr:unnamed protein product [Acanthoscelides obtectus]CAK1673921.1 hypothetical protein AOBTE_LOCUS29475 [Acanthoscelides obtectus]